MLVVLLVVCIFMTNVGARDCSERFANECECYYSGMKSCCAITMFDVIVKFAKLHGTELASLSATKVSVNTTSPNREHRKISIDSLELHPITENGPAKHVSSLLGYEKIDYRK
ncbi:hypothetical protein OSTOST_17628, partial [Ostertagia ostertagi]